jgi:HEPN domain-containing protein
VATLEILKQRIVAYALINTADEDYVTARWAFANNINRNFFWHSAIAIEKYLKSGLLLNHRSAKSEGHNILTLFDRVLEFSGELIDDGFEIVEVIGKLEWTTESKRDFVEKIKKYGDPNSRYDFYSYRLDSCDLYKLDQIVFQIRRICCDLKAPSTPFTGPSGPTMREMFLSNPNVPIDFNGRRLRQIFESERFPGAANAALWNNYAFKNVGFPASGREGVWRAAAGNRIVDMVFDGSWDFELKRDALEWMLCNIKLPSSDVGEIKAFIKRGR